jgi:hypothetical protein
MQWIKRNLFLVGGGIVALALLGFAGFYLYTKIQQDNAVSEELSAATTKLETLAKRDPYPNPDNIKAAKDEGKRLQGFLGDVEKHFAGAPYPAQLDSREFRAYLDTTRAKLLNDAQKAGVEVPTNYWFTFGAQKGSFNFPANSLIPLASQLADIQSMCQVLFDAKVNSLVWLRRVPVDSQDNLGSQDYLNAKAVTNSWGVIFPYEVTFNGFSSQLATVLEGLDRLPYCFIVTNIVVEPAANAASPTEGSPFVNPYANMATDPQAMLAQRYGASRYGMASRYGNRYAGAPQMMQPVQPVVQSGPRTILDEKPLRFILYVQAVKLKPRK